MEPKGSLPSSEQPANCFYPKPYESSPLHPADVFNPLNPELNPICYLLALLAHHFLHVSRI